MRKVIKAGIIVLILMITASPGIGLIYYFSVFRPHVPNMEKMIDNAPDIYKTPTVKLVRVVYLIEHDESIRIWVTRRMVGQHLGRMKQSRWHLHTFLWYYLIPMHFDDDEIFTLWCCVAPYGDGLGLEGGARYLFQRGLDQLNTEELISVVAYGRSPGHYKRNPDVFQERVDSYV